MIVSVFLLIDSINFKSSKSLQLIFTFNKPPFIAAIAHKLATPASEIEFGLPCNAISFVIFMQS